jgi:PAS domain S-box-containing protein
MRPEVPFCSAGSTDRLSLLLESTGEGIFGIDMAGCCVFVNRSAAQMLGWPAEAIIGRNMHELIHHTHADGAHYPEADCPIFNAFRQGLPCRIDDEVLWRADGSAFDAEYTSHPIVGARPGAGRGGHLHRHHPARERAEEPCCAAPTS